MLLNKIGLFWSFVNDMREILKGQSGNKMRELKNPSENQILSDNLLVCGVPSQIKQWDTAFIRLYLEHVGSFRYKLKGASSMQSR